MYPSATRVLIVDDDRDISSLLSTLMNKEGLTSLTAYDGETALQMVPVARPDMLLVDVKMPGIDGLTVLKRVKETDPHLPVVLITAYAEVPSSVAAMRAGAFDYLSKPFEHPEVMRVVRAALAERAREQARANEELAQHNRDIGLLNEMGEMLQSCHAVAEANDIIEPFLGRLFAEDSGGLFIFSASRNLAEAVAVWGDASPLDKVFVPDDCWALRRGKAHMGWESAGAPQCAHVPGQTGAYLCVPLMSHGEAMGLLHVLLTSPDEGLLERKQRLALTVAGQLGLALTNLKMQESLREMAVRDPLTGLFNRRYLEETMEREFLRATRQGAPIALIMLDIDHFKRYNDTYGHDAGDVVLQKLGAFLQSYSRGSDVACRYGGEEFVLTLPQCSLGNACRRAEEMRQAVKTLQVHHGHRTLEAITLSFGVAAFPEHGDKPDAVLNAADSAMYRAKQQGRDRVVAASGDSARQFNNTPFRVQDNRSHLKERSLP